MAIVIDFFTRTFSKRESTFIMSFNGKVRWPRGTNTVAERDKYPTFRDRWPSQDRWLSQDLWLSWDRIPSRNRWPSQNRCPSQDRWLPEIADRPKFASQSHSLVYTFLVEPRFQRNRGKDRKGAIRSQETEEQEGLSYRKYTGNTCKFCHKSVHLLLFLL